MAAEDPGEISKAEARDEMAAISAEMHERAVDRFDAHKAVDLARQALRLQRAHEDMMKLHAHAFGQRRKAVRALFATHAPPGWINRPPPPAGRSLRILDPRPFRVAVVVVLVLAAAATGTLIALENTLPVVVEDMQLG